MTFREWLHETYPTSRGDCPNWIGLMATVLVALVVAGAVVLSRT